MNLTGTPPFQTPSPVELCYNAAEEICAILELCNECIPQLPCDLIFPIFNAARTLLHKLRHSSIDLPTTQRQLELCFSWLSVFGKNWKSAREREKVIHECKF